jgi:hypothetical protein
MILEVINALSTITWPGAIAVVAVSAGAVCVTFAIVKVGSICWNCRCKICDCQSDE